MTVTMAVTLVGCSTVTITQQGRRKLTSTPTYEKKQSFFLWGLAGERWIDTREVCGGNEPKQMQTQFTFVDGLLNFITLGIYAPRTAKVWCE